MSKKRAVQSFDVPGSTSLEIVNGFEVLSKREESIQNNFSQYRKTRHEFRNTKLNPFTLILKIVGIIIFIGFFAFYGQG